MTLGHLNEDSLLRKFHEFARDSRAKQIRDRHIILGIGDDAAILRPSTDQDTILTCDWFLEGLHFLRHKHPPESVGWKCLARALSDVAAMGGVPRCFLLSLALPKYLTGRWLDGFLRGLRRAAGRFQCALAGGDTTRRDEILINIAVVGEIGKNRGLPRSGARPGDIIFVSGRLGEAQIGLQLLKNAKKRLNLKRSAMKKHLYPEPRLELGQWLEAHRIATAMMDLSDGLSSDLPRLCSASGVGARIQATALPTPQSSTQDHAGRMDSLQLALHGGDDYELLFTVPQRWKHRVPGSFHGVHITSIGIVTTGKKVILIDDAGRACPLVPGGWDPFSSLIGAPKA